MQAHIRIMCPPTDHLDFDSCRESWGPDNLDKRHVLPDLHLSAHAQIQHVLHAAFAPYALVFITVMFRSRRIGFLFTTRCHRHLSYSDPNAVW